jgi:Chromate transporter
LRKTEPLFRVFLAWNGPEYAELGWLWPKHRGGMNEQASPVATLVWTFGLMSPFAVGGANSAIPEMHRIAVDVHYWTTDKQFAGVFAISQLSPGSNVLIVILIGYSVAGIFGALAATLAMCGPIAVLACFVSPLLERSHGAPWARDHPGGTGSTFDRADGRQRADPCTDRGRKLDRRPGHGCFGCAGVCGAA